MRVVAVALTHPDQQFCEGSPPKGARFLIRPDLECARLASLVYPNDEFTYADARVESVGQIPDADLILVRIGFGHEPAASVLATHWRTIGRSTVVFFGPVPTLWADSHPEWCQHYVVGDIINAWPELIEDARKGSLRQRYTAPKGPTYVPARRGLGRRPLMNTGYQRIGFIRGCSCPVSVQRLCPEYLYHGEETLLRSSEEVCGEILTLPGKHIELLDDDVAHHPDYYYNMFRQVWNYHRYWSVNAGDSLFQHPKMIDLMAKAGVRVVNLNESFLSDRIKQVLNDELIRRWLYRKVKLLHSRRILVGTRLTLKLDTEESVDFKRMGAILKQLDLDFVETRFLRQRQDTGWVLTPVRYEPRMSAGDPTGIKCSFYSWCAILNRLSRRPRRVGFYTTTIYLLRYSLAHRQDLLEGIR